MNLVGRPSNDLLGLFATQLFHGSVVVLLAFGEEHFEHSALVLLFQGVEVVNDDTDEQVEREEAAAHDEDDEVEVVVLGRLVVRLLVDLAAVHGIGHHLHPALEGGHLKEGQVGVAHVVEVDLGVDPREVLLEALELVVYHADGQPLALVVQALVELAAEKLHAHDGKDEPEHQAHQQHVEDRGDGVHQGVDHNLQMKKCLRKLPERQTFFLFTFIPCHREMALSGRKARKVLSDLKAVKFALDSKTRLRIDTYKMVKNVVKAV